MMHTEKDSKSSKKKHPIVFPTSRSERYLSDKLVSLIVASYWEGI